MRERRFVYVIIILLLCCLLSLEINTTYGEQRFSLVRPVGVQYPISQPFGPSTDRKLQEAYKEWGYNGHFGIDYACPVGTDIFACDDGAVFEANNSNQKHPNGLYVRIKHKWGSSVYCHLSSVAVLNGKRVAKNSVIGSSGKTGYVTGAHLHFGLRISGISNPGYKDYIDPQKYASFESPVTQLSTSQTKEQKKSPEVAKPPEYSQETLLLRKQIKVYNNKLKNVSSKLLRNIPNPPTIEFKLTAYEEVNAWTNGHITMGLMDFLYNNPTGNPDDKLAMVMAHIITHEKLKTESVNKMLESGLKDERINLDNKMAIFDIAFSVLKFFGPVPVAAELTKLGGERVGKAVYDWQAKRILEALQKKQENTSHFFSVLYVNNAGFDASEGLKIFNNSTAFSRQHPIDKQFWENYAKEVQAKLDNERQLAVETVTEQKKSPEVAKLPQFSQKPPLPNKVTIEDGLIKQKGSYKIYLLLDGKKYFIPDRATLNSLNFGGQSVRALTSNIFNSIPEGNSEKAKDVFTFWKEKRPRTTQKEQKLHPHVVGGRITTRSKVQKLSTTKDFNVPHIHTKTGKNTEKLPAKNSLILPDVYNRSKNHSSQNTQSYYQGLDDSSLRYEIGPNIKELDIYERIIKEDWKGRSDEFWKLYGELGDLSKARILRNLSISKQLLKQQLMQPQGVQKYNQSIPYQTTPMISSQYKEKNKGYAAGLEMITNKDKEKNTEYTNGIDRIENNSSSDSNTQFRTEGVMKVLEAFESWQTDYYMEETKRLAANKKYFTTVNAMNLKGKGIDKVWDRIIYAADNNDIVGLEKAIEVYKDLIISELRIIKNQKITHDRP